MDKLQIFKTLAPGFLPLFIFLLADMIWGTETGLIVAVLFGIFELGISYFREKFIDKFILLDTGLIMILGGISIIFSDPIFFKLKPALIELIFTVILGFSAYSHVNLILLMTKRYMKGVSLTDFQLKKMKQGLKTMFFLFFIHTILIVYSAFFMSKASWAFISGGLFYIIFGVYILLEFIRNRINKKKILREYQDDEWFDIVDESGSVTGKAPRKLCHSGPGMLHPVVHMHIIDGKNRIFLQKRADTKKIQPGMWDTAVGGHVSSGEKIDEALLRESEEELGIKNFRAAPVGMYRWDTEIESELVYMFVLWSNILPAINKNEIEDGKYWKIKKIRESIGKGILTPNFEFEFRILMEKVIK